ncbi:MAG: LPS assembly lipoprotein LptE [Pseudomonadota bacterium]
MATRRSIGTGVLSCTLLLGLLASVLVLGGCGFQLRSWDFDESAGSIFVAARAPQPGTRSRGGGSGSGGSIGVLQMVEELNRALANANADFADDAASADLVLEVLNERSQRRNVSVGGNARTAEYEVSRGVEFQLGRGDELLIPPTWLSVQRVLQLDRNNIVGSSAEQTLVERELRNDLVQQILRSMNQTLKPADAAAD